MRASLAGLGLSLTGTGHYTWYGVDHASAHSGAWGAWFGDDNGMTFISEMLPTTPGATYTASFWIANNAGSPTPQNEFQVFWNGVMLVDGIDEPSAGWTHMQGPLKATGTQTEIKFGFRNGPGWFRLDDVSVNIPEPAGVLFCAGGLGLIAMFRRRRPARR